jgi:hypothetical protein
MKKLIRTAVITPIRTGDKRGDKEESTEFDL